MDTATALINENAAFAELLRDADLSMPVPTCPEWTLEQLMHHVGRGDRWCTQIVSEKLTDRLDPREVSAGKPPAGSDNQITWLHGGVRALIDAVEKSGTQTSVWTFLGPRPASWWIRRRLHETVVHRADAALTLDTEFTISPTIAADAITEYLERVMIRSAENDPAWGGPPLDIGQSLHLHATDAGLGVAGEWTIFGRESGIEFEHGHGKATVALRGPARDLLLAIVRRADVTDLGVEIFGDQEVWDTWLARTPF